MSKNGDRFLCGGFWGKLVFGAGVCLCLPFVVLGCAKKTDSLKIYSILHEEETVALTELFTEKTKIPAVFLRASTGELVNRVIAEKDSPQAVQKLMIFIATSISLCSACISAVNARLSASSPEAELLYIGYTPNKSITLAIPSIVFGIANRKSLIVHPYIIIILPDT